jgi:hypothetical protein
MMSWSCDVQAVDAAVKSGELRFSGLTGPSALAEVGNGQRPPHHPKHLYAFSPVPQWQGARHCRAQRCRQEHSGARARAAVWSCEPQVFVAATLLPLALRKELHASLEAFVAAVAATDAVTVRRHRDEQPLARQSACPEPCPGSTRASAPAPPGRHGHSGRRPKLAPLAP